MKLEMPHHTCTAPPTSQVTVYMHACPDLYSNQLTNESKWTFVPNVMTLPQGVHDILH